MISTISDLGPVSAGPVFVPPQPAPDPSLALNYPGMNVEVHDLFPGMIDDGYVPSKYDYTLPGTKPGWVVFDRQRYLETLLLRGIAHRVYGISAVGGKVFLYQISTTDKVKFDQWTANQKANTLA